MASLPFPDAVSTINSNSSNDSGNIRKPSTPQHSSSSDATSQSTNVSSSSSNPQSSTTSSNPIADVETTNWNAVAMLASKYGINLRRSGEMNRPRPSDLEGGDQPEDDGVDLGIGTPFRITAKKEGDKIIYRFKSRGPSPATSSTSYPASSASAPSSSNRPRKAAAPPGQSSPAAYSSNPKNQKSLKGSRSIPALRASGILRGAALSNNPSSPSSSNSQDSSNPQSSHPQQQPETDLDVLETAFNSGLSPSAPGGGAAGALAALGLGTRAGMSRDLAAANASKSRNNFSAAGVDPSASTTQGGKNGRINEKSPGYGMPLQEGDVLGAILGLNDLIGGGGFKQDQQAFSSPKPSQQGSSKSSLIAEEIAEEEVPPVEKVSSPSAQSQTRSSSSSPTRERRGLRRTTKGGLPSGSPSAAFSALSNPSPTELSSREGTGIGLGLSHSVDDPPTFQKSPPVFQWSSHPGNDGILLPRSTSAGEVPTIGSLALSEASTSTSESKSGLSASQRFNAASGVQSIPSSLSWDRSPIPQMQHLGQPLFDDLEAHASSFGLSSPIPESSLLGAKVEKDENLRRLREAQSWESSGTARGTDISSYNQLKWSEYPQSLVPHLQANFRRESLESQIRESDEDRSDSEAVKKPPTSKSNSHLDMNLYCEEAFIFDVLQHYTQQGALAAARSQGVNITKSITFADPSTPKTPDLSSNPNASTPSPNPNSSSRTPSSRRGSIAAALSPVKGSTTSNSSTTTSASDVSSSVSSAASGPSDNSSSVDNSSHVSQAQDTSASAAPGDDPRFSLWAVRANDAAGTLVLAGRDGVVAKIGSQSIGKDPSGSATGSSSSREAGLGGQASGKRWSIKGNNGIETSAPGQDKAFKSSNPTYSGNSENVKDLILFPPGRSSLVAASSIRLVAELTSEIDHRLLTDFFYTYRPFLTPSSLLELLTLRFHWALSTPQGPHDEARRRIVIVRTYVVIKYWLLHFFEVDFLPNSALRKQLTTWLNNLAKDKSLPIRPADMSIIKSLKKVVRNLKETYSLMGVGGLLVNDAGKSPTSANLGQLSSSSGDDSYSPSTSSDPTRVSKNSSEDSHASSSELKSPKMSEDVDLEFNGSSSEVQRTVTASRSGNAGQRRSVGESALGLGMVGDRSSAEAKKAVFSNNGASSWSEKEGDLGSGSTPGRRTNQYGSTSGLGTLLSVQAPPPPLPHSHNAISRVFVNTVGRLARFKRVLGTARASPFPFPNGPDAGLEDLEFEANDSGDLLFIRGGLENFINSFNLPPMAISPAIGRTGNEGEDQEGDESTDPENGISDGTTQDETPSLSTTSGKSRSTPASSLDLSSDAARIRAGLGIEAVDVEAEQFALDEEIRRSRRSRSGDDGMDGDAEDEGELSPPLKHNLDATNLLSLQRLTESESRKPFSDHLHHATSEQTLRSISTVEPRRASPTSPARNVAASIRSQRSSEHPQFSRSGSRASIHSRKLASRLAFAPGAEMSRSNSRISTTSGGQPRIVQIDDIDLSSDEDDGVVRRALRRLPGARDLRMANHVHDLEPSRQSFDSLSNSSLGRVHAAHASISDFSLRSYAPSMVSLSAAAAAHASTARPAIGTVQTEMLDPDEALEGYELVRGFRLDGMDSDEDEPGDVEAALMRLEGVIDEEKQREKARRVERMWQDSQLRKAEDDERKKSRIQSRSSARDTRVSRSEGGESFEEDEGAAADEEMDSDQPTSQSLARQPSLVSRRTMEDVDEDSDSDPISELATRTSRTNYDQQRSPPPSTASLSPENGTPRSRAAALASSGRPTAPRASSTGTTRSNRPVSHAGIVYGSPSTTAASGGTGSWAQAQAAQQARAMDRAIASSKFGLWTLPPVHRSFLLGYRSEVIAQQLCLIEAELFKAVTWEELASDRWKERSASGGSEVVDWESFYQARVRERAEDKTGSYKERAVEAIIARFNLTCNWVVSEIVLTQNVEERAAVVAKLIRVAWKCYHQSNFASLTQIILGLQSPWVERLRKTWARIGMWEMRILRDLKNFTSPLRNFSLLRNALQGMVAQSGMEDLVTSAGPPQASGTQYQGQSGSQKPRNAQGREIHVSDGCIPFFGLFISDLAVNDAFPSFIDPSCPSSVPETDSTGALVRLSKPDAFDHLQPLPPGVKLEPLINLYKFRVTAMTIKTVLAFQERAKAYKYEADGGVYVKCLKIRCLSGEQMTQISHHAEP